jgi:hypothetical protein
MVKKHKQVHTSYHYCINYFLEVIKLESPVTAQGSLEIKHSGMLGMLPPLEIFF